MTDTIHTGKFLWQFANIAVCAPGSTNMEKGTAKGTNVNVTLFEGKRGQSERKN